MLSLDQPDWQRRISEVESHLKSELQSPKGYLRALKEDFEVTRKRRIEDLLDSFFDSGIGGLDARIDDFTSEILQINQDAQVSLQFDLLSTLTNYSDLSKYPCLARVQSILRSEQTSTLLYQRIAATLFKVSNQTLSQSNKSNAGQAGEAFARAVLSSVGLVPGKHYREQYQSESGSDTDIAFPCVNDYEDSKLEVLVAVQMSTNDRARLTTSELKKGVVGYVITGNGLRASTKTLSDIGTQIISSYLDNNIRLVCYHEEIRAELHRIEELMDKSPAREELLTRKKYFENFALSLSEFAEKMSRFRFTEQGPRLI